MDRPKNNPKIGFTDNSNHGIASVKGTQDTGNEPDMKAEVVVVPNVGKEISGPKNTAPDWSA